MMSNTKTPSYEYNLKLIINNEIEQIVDSLVCNGADRKLVNKLIKEY